MMQDANSSSHFQRSYFKTIFTLTLPVAALAALISCSGSRSTHRVTQPYLTDAAANSDTSPDNAQTRQDFDKVQQELLGNDTTSTNKDPVDDFSAALDDYLANPPIAKSNDNSQPSSATTPDQEAGRITNATDPDVNAKKNAKLPVVQWDSPSRQPSIQDATPADRKENIGSAKDPLYKDKSTETGSEQVTLNTTADTAISNKTAASAAEESPVDKVKSFSRDELLVLLSAKLRREAAYSSAPLREYLTDAAMLMLDPSRRVDPDEMYDLNDRERKLLDNMQSFFIELGKQLKSTRDPETVVDAVNKLARGLGTDDRIEIPNFKLCTAVQSFGNYDEVKSTSFVRGKPHEVITYIEVGNFKPTAVDDGRFKTILTQESELYTESDGTLVFRQPAVTADDYCKNIRRDFFLVRHLTLPANLNVGSYYLKVRVKDETTQQQAEAVIPITIVASS